MLTTDEEIAARQEAAKANALRPQEAADLFQVSRVTIYNWMKDPVVNFPKPRRRHQRHVYWTEFDLRQWAEQNGFDLSSRH